MTEREEEQCGEYQKLLYNAIYRSIERTKNNEFWVMCVNNSVCILCKFDSWRLKENDRMHYCNAFQHLRGSSEAVSEWKRKAIA